MARIKPPPLLDVTPGQIEQMLELARNALPAEQFAIVEALVVTNELIAAELRKERTNLRRLRRLTGIHGSEKTRDVMPNAIPSPSEPADAGLPPNSDDGAAAASGVSPTARPPRLEPKTKGHGRLGASDYPTATHVFVSHEVLRCGDPCPHCGGRLHRFRNAPVLRILGRSMLEPEVSDLEQLRCGDCQHVFTARLPLQVQGGRYDESATAIIAIMHYQAGLPFHRIAQLQHQLQVAVPASTQWDVVNSGADVLLAASPCPRRESSGVGPGPRARSLR